MKTFFTAIFAVALLSISYAQGPAVDTHPRAKIFVIDPQSGQQMEAVDDLAVQFKDAVIDLVRKTPTSIYIVGGNGTGPVPPELTYTVTQMPPETNINGFQVSLDQLTNDPNQPPVNVYTFSFHIDDGTLYFYQSSSQQWVPEVVMQDNLFNQRRAADLGQQFDNELAAEINPNANTNPPVDLNSPVDANVVADNPPPALPDYDQPECPVDGYMWQPGYWAYSPYQGGYYWVPGAWIAPPAQGLLWTPPYWGYEGNAYIFHAGYWGQNVGFYGGINYGNGYVGSGYYGGEWRSGHFNYNTAVVHVNTTVVHNTYVNTTVVNNVVVNNNHSSFNGRGGVIATPNSAEIMASHQNHISPTAEQNANQLQARNNPNQFPKFNGGRQPVLAGQKALQYHPETNNTTTAGSKPAGWKTQPAGQAHGPAQPNNGTRLVLKPAAQNKPQIKPEGSALPGQNKQPPGGKPRNQPVGQNSQPPKTTNNNAAPDRSNQNSQPQKAANTGNNTGTDKSNQGKPKPKPKQQTNRQQPTQPGPATRQ